MPAFIPAVDAVKVNLHQTWNNQKIINTLWFKNTAAGSYTGTQRSDLGTEIVAWYNTYMKNQLGAAVSLNSIEIINQEAQNAPSLIATVVPAISGVNGQTHPLNVALVGSWRTNNRGRSYRGRYYTPGIPVSVRVDDGTITTTFAGQLATTLAKLFDPAVITKGILVVASHYFNLNPRITAALTPITAVIVETLLDSTRRRLIGRGQ
jgi:hypothetical protein